MRADISSIRATMDAKFESVDERFDRVETEVRDLRSEVRTGFAAVDARFLRMEQTMATNLDIMLTAINK
jgi:hypothetical protein